MMDSDQDKRRFAEEEIRDPKKRAAEKPNVAVSVPWILAGILVLALILSAL